MEAAFTCGTFPRKGIPPLGGARHQEHPYLDARACLTVASAHLPCSFLCHGQECRRRKNKWTANGAQRLKFRIESIMEQEPVRIPITDVFDLHIVQPKEVADVVEAYLEEAKRLGSKSARRLFTSQAAEVRAW